MLQDWTIYSWYCPNCKTEVCGIKDKKDQIKAKCERCGVQMVRKSTLLLEQIRTIDKRRLIKKMGSLSKQSQERIDQVLDKNFYI